jgi:hypothetical protein
MRPVYTGEPGGKADHRVFLLERELSGLVVAAFAGEQPAESSSFYWGNHKQCKKR